MPTKKKPRKRAPGAGRKPGSRAVVNDDQLATVIFLAGRRASRAAISRATGVSLRQVFYFIEQYCPLAGANIEEPRLSVAEALKIDLAPR